MSPPAKRTATTQPRSAAASTAANKGNQFHNEILQKVVKYYTKSTNARTKLIDVFLVFLVVVGVLQFVYCVVAGSYPFNAFLSGFCATVGQFVFTASLRAQTQEMNSKDFPEVSPERAFADFVVCSLLLHFFCVNFIN